MMFLDLIWALAFFGIGVAFTVIFMLFCLRLDDMGDETAAENRKLRSENKCLQDVLEMETGKRYVKFGEDAE